MKEIDMHPNVDIYTDSDSPVLWLGRELMNWRFERSHDIDQNLQMISRDGSTFSDSTDAVIATMKHFEWIQI
jgi:hypothetical protein